MSQQLSNQHQSLPLSRSLSHTRGIRIKQHSQPILILLQLYLWVCVRKHLCVNKPKHSFTATRFQSSDRKIRYLTVEKECLLITWAIDSLRFSVSSVGMTLLPWNAPLSSPVAAPNDGCQRAHCWMVPAPAAEQQLHALLQIINGQHGGRLSSQTGRGLRCCYDGQKLLLFVYIWWRCICNAQEDGNRWHKTL